MSASKRNNLVIGSARNRVGG